MTRFWPTWILATSFALLLTTTPLGAVQVGATKDEVLKELGPPVAEADAGDREILTYPKKVQIIFEDGKVTNAIGLRLSVEEPLPAVEPTPTVTPTPTRRVAPSQSPSPSLRPTFAPTIAVARDLAPRRSNAVSPSQMPHVIDRLPVSGKLLLLGLHLGLTLLGLQLAFSFWEIEMQHSGMFLVALIDVMAHGVLDFLGPISNGWTTHPAIESVLPALVMLVAIWSFSVRKKWSDAFRTAGLINLCVALFQFGFAVLLLSALAR